jgi:hypothetical protein
MGYDRSLDFGKSRDALGSATLETIAPLADDPAMSFPAIAS